MLHARGHQDSRGRRLPGAGATAFAELLKLQPTPALRFAGHLLRFPPIAVVAAIGYNLIARYRHVLPGGTPACALPRP